MNKKVVVFVSLVGLSLAGCAAKQEACEDVTLASEQVRSCQLLQRQISQAKDQPVLRSELERRYENDCTNVRYYRDDQQNAICGNKNQIESLIEKKQ